MLAMNLPPPSIWGGGELLCSPSQGLFSRHAGAYQLISKAKGGRMDFQIYSPLVLYSHVVWLVKAI